jgi:putative Holliday junction resolvase
MRGTPDYCNDYMMILGTNQVMNASTSKMRTFLAFDYGLKRIGVAVGQELTGTATALTVIRASEGKPDWDAIAKLIEQWKPDELVVGLPTNMDGTFHELSYKAQRFGNQLHGRYNLRAHFIDERLSSLEAEQQIKNQQQQLKKNTARVKGRKGQASDIDKIAAKVILESWLNQQNARTKTDEATR